MEFTKTQKRVAVAIATILLLGFLSSTVTSIVRLLTPNQEISEKVENKQYKPSVNDNNFDADSAASRAEAYLDSLDEDFEAGFMDVTSNSDANQASSKPSNSSDTNKAVSEDGSSCSKSLRASIDGYREGLVKNEYERRDTELRKGATSETSATTNNESEANNTESEEPALGPEVTQDAPTPSMVHESRLNAIEKAYQSQLKMHNCI